MLKIGDTGGILPTRQELAQWLQTQPRNRRGVSPHTYNDCRPAHWMSYRTLLRRLNRPETIHAWYELQKELNDVHHI